MKGTSAALALWCCAAALAGCVGAQPTPDTPIVADLEIEGADAVDKGLIRARIVTAETSWLPFTEKQYYDEVVFETDLKRILRLYQAEGYYKARIVDRTVAPSGPKRVDITVRIEEGPPTTVRELTVEGLDALAPPDRNVVLHGLPLASGMVFKEAAYDTFKAELANRLREAGYAEASVEGQVEVDLPTDSARVTVNVDPGLRFKFGQVFVAGANHVPRRRILDTATSAISPGALYHESSIDEAQGRVFDLGVFSAVKVTRGAPDRTQATMPVVVNVREAPFRTKRYSGGFGIDRGRQELPRAGATWIHRNFFGGLRKLTFENEASLVFFDLNLTEPQVALSSKLELEQPEFLARTLSATTSLGVERGVERSFEFIAGTARFGLPWRLTRNFTFTPSYNFSVFKLTGDAASAAGTTTQEAALDDCAKNKDLCLLAYLEQRFTYDRRDSGVEATRGTFTSLSLQEGSRYLGGKYNYLRFLPEVRAYFRLGRHVLAARAMAGMLLRLGTETSSVLTRFYTGGSGSQRGFGERELSPRVLLRKAGEQYACLNEAGQPIFDAHGDPTTCQALPIGGDGMLASNLELRLRVAGDFGAVLFVDTGEVTQNVEDLSLARLHVAAGGGLRYRTLFGPVRFDLAWRLNNPDVEIDGVPRKLLFSRWDRLSLHLSIGEAF